MRRNTIGSDAGITIIEWADGVELGSEQFKHPSLQQCMVISTDLTWM